jgi:ATP/maltotriose-dependent transcriptional regulator MalT
VAGELLQLPVAVLDSLARGRQAVVTRRWKEAYAILSEAERSQPLGPSDLELLATAAYLIGDDEGSASAWTRAYHAWLRVNEKRRAARCAFWLILELFSIAEWARGGGWLSTAERLFEGEPDCAERGLLLVMTARTHAKNGDFAAAHDAFSRAARLAASCGDPELNAFALLGLAQAKANRGETAVAMTLFDEVMVAVTTATLPPISVGVIYCAVIEACYDILDLARAREWTAALTRWCDLQTDLVPYRGHCLVHRAETMRLSGDWSNAFAQAGQVCALANATGDAGTAVVDHRSRAYPLGAAFYETAEIHRLRGRFAEAEEAYRLAHDNGRSPEPGLALLRLAQGRIDLAAAAIRRQLEQRQRRALRAAVLAAGVEIMVAAGDLASARRAADELAAMASGIGVPYLRAVSAQANGMLLHAAGKPRDGFEALRSAWMEWQALEAPYEAARVRVLMGWCCRDLGDVEASQLELEAARRVFKRLGATRDIERIDQALRRSIASARPLTARELQVLRLIAAGATNRRIADALAISERTVDRHVSNILTKLDLSSRAAATAYAYQHGLVH